ncbi:MAG: MmcQ/YjbR family DNA-binding protein [Pseudomonadota bacterium]
MTRAEFDALCAALPGATLSGPGELDAWKVGGKMFACFGHTDQRATNTEHVAVHCGDNETAEMLIDAGAVHKAPYFRGAWARLYLDGLEVEEARHRIDVSYAAIRSKLTKKLQAALDAGEQ